MRLSRPWLFEHWMTGRAMDGFAAVRIAERWMGESSLAEAREVHAAVLRKLDDEDCAVRRHRPRRWQRCGRTSATGRCIAARAVNADDPITVDAALSGLEGSEAEALSLLLRSNEQTPQREAAVTMLAATVVRSSEDASIQRLFGCWRAAAGRSGSNRRCSGALRWRCSEQRCLERRRREAIHHRPAHRV